MDKKKNLAKSYIALGSNVGDPLANVRQAIEKLSADYKLCAKSSLYLTKPWGYVDQSDFINAVVLIETDLSPHLLLKELQAIEKDMGRERHIHWGPRTIDLDILTYNDETIHEPDLIIPHRYMLERAFVLAPLCEIDTSYSEAYNSLPRKQHNEIQRL